MTHKINTPNNQSISKTDINGMSAQLKWNSSFGGNRSQSFDSTQKYIDSECIRLMKPYTPFLSGVLENSATIGTTIGSGEIRQTVPYAKMQYYGKLMVSSITGSAYALHGESKVLTDIDLKYNKSRHSLSGAYWFERMKADNKEKVRKGASQYTKRG